MAEPLKVAILGAGAAGLCMGIKLSGAGITDFRIFEKSDRVGGTWRDNSYPGAACDVPSHLYSYSFARKRDWSRKFAEQPEILGYFEGIVDSYHLSPHIQFGAEAVSATFDDSDGLWRISFRDGSEAEALCLVAGLGQLNRPMVPDIPGLDAFAGEAFHSARWNHDLDLTGRHVAVIGNGASAVQFVPHVVEAAQRVTVFQRSANWIIPKPDREFRPREIAAFRRVPGWELLIRWWTYWRLELNFTLMRRNSRLGALLARMITKELEKIVGPQLPAEALIPDYPPGCKRLLISNDYYQALLQPKTSVELSHIERVTADAVVTTDGTVHEVDTIIFGTGFESTQFLAPMVITGRDGRGLNDAWADGAQAHLGITVAGFPNLFLLYGPNTNLGHNSIIFMIEAQTRYATNLIQEVARGDVAWVDVRPDVMDRFNAKLQDDAADTVWAASCDSWYKNEQGRITNNWPRFTVAYWNRLRAPRPEDFVRRVRLTAPTPRI